MTTQTMPGAVKLKKPPTYDRTIDYEAIEAWLFEVEKLFHTVRAHGQILAIPICEHVAYHKRSTVAV